MKKVLLATTALMGVALFAGTATAEVTVKVGGFLSFRAGFFDDDRPNSSDRDFQTEGEVHVRADGRADNGLQYGVKLELEATPDRDFAADESIIYVAGSWGRVELGEDDGASDQLMVAAPDVGIAGGDFDEYDDFVPELDTDLLVVPLDSDDSTKITYFTPRWAGIQLGVSYAPELNSVGEDVVDTDLAGPAPGGDNTQKDIVEIGANYEGEFQGFSVGLGGGYVFGDAKSGSGVEDITAWGVGAQAGYAGFRFGGGYVDSGDSDQPVGSGIEVKSWNVGVAYENGPWGVGAYWVRANRDNTFDTDLYSVGAKYVVAPGLIVSADAAYYDNETAPTGEGLIFIVETRVNF